MPILTIVAGPNGSGKTTLTTELRAQGLLPGTYINADDIALTLEGSTEDRSLAAQRQADDLREAHLAKNEDFCFETVMSHKSKVDLLRRAKSVGYTVTLYFVGTVDPEINVQRVAQRVGQGGHDVPVDRIIARYHRTLGLLPEAMKAANFWSLFDNSDLDQEAGAGFRLVCDNNIAVDGQGHVELVTRYEPVPAWAQAAASQYEQHLAHLLETVTVHPVKGKPYRSTRMKNRP